MSRKHSKPFDCNMVLNLVQISLEKLCILLIICLILIQGLYSFRPLNYILNKSYKLEGSSFDNIIPVVKKGSLKIILQENLGYDEVLEIFINGESVSKLHNGTSTLLVKEGDIIEVKGSNFQKTIKLKLLSITENMIQPKTDKVYMVGNSLELIGKVKLK